MLIYILKYKNKISSRRCATIPTLKNDSNSGNVFGTGVRNMNIQTSLLSKLCLMKTICYHYSSTSFPHMCFWGGVS